MVRGQKCPEDGVFLTHQEYARLIKDQAILDEIEKHLTHTPLSLIIK